MDKAHAVTNKLLAKIQSEITAIYRKTNRDLLKEIAPLLEDIYLNDDNATQKKRLRYADKNGKNEMLEKIASVILNTNQRATEIISDKSRQIYALNYKYTGDEIANQIIGGGK